MIKRLSTHLWLTPPQFIGCLMLLISAWFAWQFPLSPQFSQKLADVRTFAPTLSGGLMYAALLIVWFVLCWHAYRHVSHRQLSTRFLLGSSFIIGLPLLFVYPINANDIFRYVLRGRIVSIYGANPYLASPSDYPNDPFAHLAGEWATATSPYGPVWELTDAVVSGVAGDNLWLALVLLKLLGLLFFVACGWFIIQLVPQRAVLWCWNPAAYLMFVVDAHNDVLMLLWLLIALWMLHRYEVGWQLASASILVAWLSPLTKLTGIVFIPFLGIALLRQLPDWAARVRFMLVATIGIAVLTLAAFAPFGDPRLLLTRLVSETQAGGAFSPTIFIYFIDKGTDAITLDLARLFEVGTPTFVAIACVMVIWTFFGRNPLRASADTYLAYLLTALNYRIWYALWIFPWVLIDETSEFRLRVGYLFLITSQLSVVLYGHLRAYVFGSGSTAHLIGVPFVFLFPLVGAIIWQKLD